MNFWKVLKIHFLWPLAFFYFSLLLLLLQMLLLHWLLLPFAAETALQYLQGAGIRTQDSATADRCVLHSPLKQCWFNIWCVKISVIRKKLFLTPMFLLLLTCWLRPLDLISTCRVIIQVILYRVKGHRGKPTIQLDKLSFKKKIFFNWKLGREQNSLDTNSENHRN